MSLVAICGAVMLRIGQQALPIFLRMWLYDSTLLCREYTHMDLLLAEYAVEDLPSGPVEVDVALPGSPP